jgi:hypothetical protein
MPGIADEKNKYENESCKECPKLEAKALKRGRGPETGNLFRVRQAPGLH